MRIFALLANPLIINKTLRHLAAPRRRSRQRAALRSTAQAEWAHNAGGLDVSLGPGRAEVGAMTRAVLVALLLSLPATGLA
jgi:hypothetical protein